MASINSTKSFKDYMVNVWLDHPQLSTLTTGPAPSLPALNPTTWKSTSRKRRRDDSHDNQEADYRRDPLRETTMNLPSADGTEISSRKRLREDSNRGISPLKIAHTTSQLVDNESAVDSYSRALQCGEITLLPQRGIKSNSSTRSRSSSPVKTIYDLTMADPPITFSEANSKSIQPPAAISQLYKRIVEVSDGFELLPESLSSSIIAYCEEFETRVPRHQYFETCSNSPRDPTQQEQYTWEAVKRIRQNATRCSEDGDSEAGWGEMVYSPLLDVALRHSPHKHSVGWKNITTARIEPKSLGPKHLSGKLFGPKMVDYSIILLPNEKMHQAILQVLRDLPEEHQNINHTNSTPVKYRPITVNIEVKLPGEGKNDAMVQLAVWGAAQMAKLNALAQLNAPSETPVPIGIPLVSVEGHDWRLYITYQEDDSGLVSQRVWGNNLFGDSSSILGIYKVIAAIQILAEWSCNEYRAWFEKDVLKSQVEI